MKRFVCSLVLMIAACSGAVDDGGSASEAAFGSQSGPGGRCGREYVCKPGLTCQIPPGANPPWMGVCVAPSPPPPPPPPCDPDQPTNCPKGTKCTAVDPKDPSSPHECRPDDSGPITP
jgi:hypothetical protein